jgi:electron transfer flavoprotein beta subunit
MHLVVLLKQVLDPEVPARSFRVNRQTLTPDMPRAPRVMSIFDGNALEVALKLRETKGDVTVSVLTLGDKAAEDMLRKALAVTADAAYLMSDPDALQADSGEKARLIAAAVRKLAPVDIVLAGRQAADWEAGLVGSMVAEELAWPCVTFVSKIHVDDGGLRLRREVEEGYQIVRASGPVVITITNDESNVLRFAKVRDSMAAMRKPIVQWTTSDLGVPGIKLDDPAEELVDLFTPEPASHAEMIEGTSAGDQAQRLAQRLRELQAL